MSISKVCSVVTDWTAVAQNTLVKSSELDLSDAYMAILHVQGALDSTTAHTGTQFILQIAGAASGNEDWGDLTPFVELIGTAVTDLIEDDPLAATSTAIALTGHAYTTEGAWLLIEDATLANSELVRVASQTANEVVIMDGTTNAHVVNTPIFNVAFTKNLILSGGVYRARIIVDNTYSANGSTLDYKVTVTKVTVV